MTIEDYKIAVETLASSKSPLVFKNLDHEHASIVISTMLKHSVKSVYIYDTDLSGDIALKREEIQTEVANHLSNGKTLKILVKKGSQGNSFQEFIKESLVKFPEQLDVRLANTEFRDGMLATFSKDCNFTVGDTNKFRIEYDEEGKRKAFCTFNNESTGVILSNFFESKFDKCNKYEFGV